VLSGLHRDTGSVIRSAFLLACCVVLAGCGGGKGASSEPVPSGTMCADVVGVVITAESGGTYRFDVTVRSVETGREQYADAWEVRALDGSVLGTRILAHPHVDEQPFTRGLTGVAIPEGTLSVEVAARDLVKGFCGVAMQVAVPNY